MRLLSLLFSVALLAQFATAGRVIDNAVAAGIVSTGDVVILCDDSTLCVAEFHDIEIVDTSPNQYGLPTIEVGGRNSFISTTYQSVLGKTEVRTSCWGLSASQCARRHLLRVQAMQAIMPLASGG